MENNKTKIVAIIACAVAVCILLGVIISSAVMSTPKNTVENAVEKSFKAASKSDDAKFVEDVLNGGSIEISANLGKIMEGMGAEEGADIDLSAKLYFELSALATAFELAASMDGDALIDALVYISEEQVAVSSEALLGEEAYGIIFKDIEKNFDSSEFGEDGEYSLGITYEEIAAFVEAYESAQKPPKELEKFIGKTEDIVDDMYNVIIKSVIKHSETDKTSGTVSCAGKDVKTKDLTFVLNGESVSLIVADLYDYLANNKALNKYLTEDLVEVVPFIAEYAVSFSEFGFGATVEPEHNYPMEEYPMEEYPMEDGEDTEAPAEEEEDDEDESDKEDAIADMTEELTEQIETAVEEFYEGLEDVDIDDVTEEVMDSLEDFEGVLVVHVNKKNGQIIGLDVSAEYDGEDLVDVSVVCGPDWEEITEISVKAEYAGQKISASYEVAENTRKVYDAGIKVKQGSETVAKVDISWDKKEGDLKVKASAGDMEMFVFKGNLKASSKQVVLVLDKVTVQETEVDLGETTITVTKNDKMPKVGKINDILTLTADDFEELAESVQEAVTTLGEDLEDVFADLGGMGGGFGGFDESGDDYWAETEGEWEEEYPSVGW